MPVTAYVALGSNLASAAGDRMRTLEAAFDQLAATPGVALDARSSAWEYDAVGGPPGSPPFLNAVARLRTTLDPLALLRALRAIEDDLGRRRTPDRNAPRTLDLDLLLYDDRMVREPGLDVPHPRMHERRFVLEPLAEISPGAPHPPSGLTAAELLARVVQGRAVSSDEFLPLACRRGAATARLNTLDRICALSAALFVAPLLLGIAVLTVYASRAVSGDIPVPVAALGVVLIAACGWGVVRSIHVAWRHSAGPIENRRSWRRVVASWRRDDSRRGFPVIPSDVPS